MKYRGVAFARNRNKWRAMIVVDGHKVHLGFFDSAIRAAREYDKHAHALDMRVNFPEDFQCQFDKTR